MAVRGALQGQDGKIGNLDETISELIGFWKNHAKAFEIVDLWPTVDDVTEAFADELLRLGDAEQGDISNIRFDHNA